MTNDATFSGLTRNFDEINLGNLSEAVSCLRNRGEGVNDIRRSHGKSLQESIYGISKSYHLDVDNYFVTILENIINNICGAYLKKNKVPLFLTDALDTTTVDQYNYLYTKLNNRLNYSSILTKAYEASLAYGEAFLMVHMDFDSSLEGNPSIRLVTYDRIWHDDLWISPDMSDASWFMVSEVITKNEATMRYPDYEGVIAGFSASTQYGNYGYTNRNSVVQENSVEITYAWFRTTYRQKYLYNKETQEAYYHAFDETLIDEFAKKRGLEIRTRVSKKWKVGTLIGNTAISYVDNPLFDEIPLVPFICKRRQEVCDDKPKSFGLGRRVFDMNRILNRQILGVHDKADSPLGSVVAYNENAVTNKESLYDNEDRTKLLALNSNAKASDILARYDAPGVDPGSISLIQQDLNLITQITGATEELMGTAPSQRASAITSMMREESALQSYTWLFQNWDSSLMLLGRKIIKVIQNNWNVNRVTRELGGKEPSREFFDKAYLEFDVRLSKGERTDSERNRTLQQLTELAPQIRFDEHLYLENMNIEDRAGKVEASKAKVQQAQKDSEDKRQIEMAMQEQQAQKLFASAFRDIEAGRERADRQLSNMGLNIERASEAIKNHGVYIRDVASALAKLKDSGVTREDFNKLLSKFDESLDDKKQEIEESEDRFLAESREAQQQDLRRLEDVKQQQGQEAQQSGDENAEIAEVQEGNPSEEV